MDIHEYQAKELLSNFGVPIPRGIVAYTPDQAVYRAEEIGGGRWVVKAQIHSGARALGIVGAAIGADAAAAGNLLAHGVQVSHNGRSSGRSFGSILQGLSTCPLHGSCGKE